MTEIENDPKPRPRGVIDPAWEDELRSGQAAEGEQGSVEPELELLHLLRHVREPDSLAPEQLDALWSAIAAEVAPVATPWWRKTWLWWSAPALAAVAVLAVIVIDDGKQEAPNVAHNDEKRSESANLEAKAEAPTPSAAAPSDEFAGFAEEAEGSAAGARSGATKDDKQIARAGGSNAFEASFQELAPYGRRAIRGSVDTSRDQLRSQLLADARGATR